jgi:ornithine carbamoyltransferase
LGGIGLYLNRNDLQLGRGETIKDTAIVLSRYLNGIIIRAFSHQMVLELAKYASIPVINALTDLLHPCQAISDFFTIYEYKKNFKNIKIAYIGDGNNVANSLTITTSKLGGKIFLASPKGYFINEEIYKLALEFSKKSNAEIILTDNPEEAAKDADVLYTDVWVSMGQENEKEVRYKIFKNYQINEKIIKMAKKDVIVMHCLPAHRGEEITDEVMDGPNSVVFDQAENRLHSQKAILTLLIP